MCPVLCIADSEPVSRGDWLFIQARVIGCGESLLNVEVGKVGDSGEVTFFEEISIQVKGKSTAEIGHLVADEVEKASGRRPTSIRIVRIPKDDPKSAALKMMEMWHHRRDGCPGPVQQKEIPAPEIPEWLYDLHLIALSSHNKSPHCLSEIRQIPGEAFG
jgi:hypothetical protein